MNQQPKVVLDTNVIVSALLSRQGASFEILRRITEKDFTVCISVPLVLEYEDALKRNAMKGRMTAGAIDQVLDYLCATAEQHRINFLWRPHLKDPKDDMVLELALAAGCDYIVTLNLADFRIKTRGPMRVVTPADLVTILEKRK